MMMMTNNATFASVSATEARPAMGFAGTFVADGAFGEFQPSLAAEDFWAAAAEADFPVISDTPGGWYLEASDATSVVSSLSSDSSSTLTAAGGSGFNHASTDSLEDLLLSGAVGASSADAAVPKGADSCRSAMEATASTAAASTLSASSSMTATVAAHRRASIAKWREKRARLLSGKARRVPVVERSKIASSRVRVGGRFVKSAVKFGTMAAFE